MDFRLVGKSVLAVVAVTSFVAGAAPCRAQDAASLYSASCSACHGPSGKGDGPAATLLNPKPKEFATALKGKSDDWIAKSIKEGGAAVGEAPTMAAFGDKLNSGQINALVAYVKQLGAQH